MWWFVFDAKRGPQKLPEIMKQIRNTSSPTSASRLVINPSSDISVAVSVPIFMILPAGYISYLILLKIYFSLPYFSSINIITFHSLGILGRSTEIKYQSHLREDFHVWKQPDMSLRRSKGKFRKSLISNLKGISPSGTYIEKSDGQTFLTFLLSSQHLTKGQLFVGEYF